jgi:hypothetical protein
MNGTGSKLGMQLGLASIAIGILIIGLAWNGAAGIDFVSGQIPYLLSGGALGLALVGVGVALVIVHNNRRDRALLQTQIQELSTSVSRLANAVYETSSNGHGDTPATAAPAGELVVVGRNSYHRPECRLVAGKDLQQISVASAQGEGLSACRICNPVAEGAPQA